MWVRGFLLLAGTPGASHPRIVRSMLDAWLKYTEGWNFEAAKAVHSV